MVDSPQLLLEVCTVASHRGVDMNDVGNHPFPVVIGNQFILHRKNKRLQM